MAKVGPNNRLTASQELEKEITYFFGEILGCSSIEPMPGLRVFQFEGGHNMGVYFVPPEEALSKEDGEKAAWFEFCVEDLDGTAARLEKAGFELMDYEDKEFRYYRPPWGQIFRLAPLS